jgi:hypothetical protein
VAAHGVLFGLSDSIAEDFNQSRIHGLQNIDALVAEWSGRLPISEATIRTYLTTNIHYTLDEECLEGMRGFFRTAAELRVLPEYSFHRAGPKSATASGKRQRPWKSQYVNKNL